MTRSGLAGLLAVLALAGCAGPPHECTAIGATSGVFVTGGQPGGVLQVCVHAECSSLQTGGGARFLELPSLGVQKQSIRTTYTVGARVVSGETTVSAVKRQPNGPDCEPTVAVANLAVRPDGHVVQATK